MPSRTQDRESAEVSGSLATEVREAATEATVSQVLVRLAYFVWPHRKFVFGFVTSVVALVTIAVFLWPKTYTAHAALAPPDNKLTSAMNGMGAGGGSASLGLELLALGGMKDPGALYVAMLQSHTVETNLINRFDLRKVYRIRYYDPTRKALEKHTRIVQDIKSGVTTIEVDDHDPVRARDLAQGYIDELNRMTSGLNSSAAHRERVFIEDRLKVVKANLDEAARAFSQFSSKNTAIDLSQQGKAMVEAAATLQGELIAAQSQLKGLEQIYSANNIRVRSLQARVAELKTQLNDMGGSPGTGDTTRTDSTSAQLNYPTLRQLPLLGVKYFDLYRESKIQEQVYEILTKQYELAKIEEAKETPTVRVMDYPTIPERKSFPPRGLIVMSSLPLALGLSLFWLYANDKYRRLEPDDAVKVLGSHMGQHFRAFAARWPSLRRKRDIEWHA